MGGERERINKESSSALWITISDASFSTQAPSRKSTPCRHVPASLMYGWRWRYLSVCVCVWPGLPFDLVWTTTTTGQREAKSVSRRRKLMPGGGCRPTKLTKNRTKWKMQIQSVHNNTNQTNREGKGGWMGVGACVSGFFETYERTCPIFSTRLKKRRLDWT